MESKTILAWTSKVQYKKNMPYVYLLKHLSQHHVLSKGNEVTCKLVLVEEKLSVIIELE